MLRLVKECSEFIGKRIVGSVKLDYTNRQMRKRDKLGLDRTNWSYLVLNLTCRIYACDWKKNIMLRVTKKHVVFGYDNFENKFYPIAINILIT